MDQRGQNTHIHTQHSNGRGWMSKLGPRIMITGPLHLQKHVDMDGHKHIWLVEIKGNEWWASVHCNCINTQDEHNYWRWILNMVLCTGGMNYWVIIWLHTFDVQHIYIYVIDQTVAHTHTCNRSVFIGNEMTEMGTWNVIRLRSNTKYIL